MKSLGKFLKYKKTIKRKNIDQETVFYLLNKIIKIKYGEVGLLNIKPDFFKDKKIFLRIKNSNWANEVWLNKEMLVMEVNKMIGDNEIKEIKIKKE